MIGSRTAVQSTLTIALQQIGLGALLCLLVIAWLHIPDANPFEVFGSVLLGLLIAGTAGAGETAIALRLTGRVVTPRRILLGMAAVFVAALLWYVLSLGFDHLGTKDSLRAGYLNSRAPASLRNLLSYPHLLLWFTWLWRVLGFLVAGLLAGAAFACATCSAPGRGLLAIYRSGRYWLSLLLLALVGGVLTGALLNWTPGHGLAVETLSLVLRLLTVIVLSALAIALLFRAMALAVERLQVVGTGAPVLNQPRTAEIP